MVYIANFVRLFLSTVLKEAMILRSASWFSSLKAARKKFVKGAKATNGTTTAKIRTDFLKLQTTKIAVTFQSETVPSAPTLSFLKVESQSVASIVSVTIIHQQILWELRECREERFELK